MGTKIYAGNLPRALTSTELERLFSAYGEVRAAEVIVDRDTGASRGFGFVEMAAAEAAQEAMSELDGHRLDGKFLVVNEAQPQRERGGRPPRGRR